MRIALLLAGWSLALAGCHPPLYADVKVQRICVEQDQDFEVAEAVGVVLPPGISVPEDFVLPGQVTLPPVPFRHAFDEDLELDEEIAADIAELRIDEFVLGPSTKEGAITPPLSALHALDVTIVPYDPGLPEIPLLAYRRDPAAPSPAAIEVRGSGKIDLKHLTERGGFRLRASIEGVLPPTVSFAYTVETRACLYMHLRVDPLDNI